MCESRLVEHVYRQDLDTPAPSLWSLWLQMMSSAQDGSVPIWDNLALFSGDASSIFI